MKRVKREEIEIMAPAGNFESLVAAIQGGADSIYFGVGRLNMRAHSANNFTLDSIDRVVELCKKGDVKSYLTLNTVIYDSEVEEMKKTVDKAHSAGVSAIIASDISVINYAASIGMEVHISTQLNISNIEALRYYSRYADVVVLARELTLHQVKAIYNAIEEERIVGPSGKLVKLELFCHGALCMAISGKCYLSLHQYNASANRGSCYQICRRGYKVTDRETGEALEIDNEYILSPKDLSTIRFVDKILDAGVRVLKIEGRARAPEYVKNVTAAYKEAVEAVIGGEYNDSLKEELEGRLSKVFNRGFWDGYYMGAKLGEWSDAYGNRATQKKHYIGKISNYFSNISVAEILVESRELSLGDAIIVIGPTTGVVESTLEEIRVDLKEVATAQKGQLCSISLPKGSKIRRGDKLYLIVNSTEDGAI
ncbi:MAG: peptidase U32 family protein [Bacteroidales bacterium]